MTAVAASLGAVGALVWAFPVAIAPAATISIPNLWKCMPRPLFLTLHFVATFSRSPTYSKLLRQQREARNEAVEGNRSGRWSGHTYRCVDSGGLAGETERPGKARQVGHERRLRSERRCHGQRRWPAHLSRRPGVSGQERQRRQPGRPDGPLGRLQRL